MNCHAPCLDILTLSLCSTARLILVYFLRLEGTPSDAIGSPRLIRASANANGIGFGDIMRGPRQRSNILRGGQIHHVISMVYRLRGGIVIIFPSVSVCSPVCHKVRSAGAAIRASDFRLCMSTVCSGMTLICLQLIPPGMHACVHVGECTCVCIHGRMSTYLSSQQHLYN